MHLQVSCGSAGTIHTYISLSSIKTAIQTFNKMIAAPLSWLKSLLALDELLNNPPAHVLELTTWAGKGKNTPKPSN